MRNWSCPRMLEALLAVARDPRRRQRARLNETRTALWKKMITLVAMGQARGEITKEHSPEEIATVVMLFTLGGHACEGLGGRL